MPRPEVQHGCTVCFDSHNREARARAQKDGSAETDARVLWRQHLATTHGIDAFAVRPSAPASP
ncbi:hypothetical protein C7C46_23300 [Streptomyces tateyamensis]|uniref:Uncharacterized protein n=1 Tax=Streptomyces tateyamensis TaxID=565073 RepID=A0A2V4N4D9_9ACTN|nr:hypothetical protein C7C46_23300 [Streptomyces tateyamensis]